MVTTATWASLFPPPPSAHFGSPAPSATGEGRSDREGVRDIERDARFETNYTRTGTPSAACERHGQVRRGTRPARHVTSLGGPDGRRRARRTAAPGAPHGVRRPRRAPRAPGPRRWRAATDPAPRR